MPAKLVSLALADPVGEIQEIQTSSNMSTAADLLKQGAACNVLYLNSVETESLTGPQAIAKATGATLSRDPRPPGTVVHFKVSAQGITLTDSQRRIPPQDVTAPGFSHPSSVQGVFQKTLPCQQCDLQQRGPPGQEVGALTGADLGFLPESHGNICQGANCVTASS
ncbi:hypothetical protein Z043_113703 [Scleropages formosus]|uniref:PTB domain-containing protein n=1 Tax=Scleropages formosus TaxID=113540 RepID=A0A0P7V4E6_SCLFO|nr:hypothetical protein Z043_113703 [Scleropages formosus]